MKTLTIYSKRQDKGNNKRSLQNFKFRKMEGYWQTQWEQNCPGSGDRRLTLPPKKWVCGDREWYSWKDRADQWQSRAEVRSLVKGSGPENHFFPWGTSSLKTIWPNRSVQTLRATHIWRESKVPEGSKESLEEERGDAGWPRILATEAWVSEREGVRHKCRHCAQVLQRGEGEGK